MGLSADIYRCSLGDCSNDGISSRHTQVCIVNIDGPDKPSSDQPAAELVVRQTNSGKHVYAVPCDLKGKSMAGGTFVHTSDSRFSAAVSKLLGYRSNYPVALHDRVER